MISNQYSLDIPQQSENIYKINSYENSNLAMSSMAVQQNHTYQNQTHNFTNYNLPNQYNFLSNATNYNNSYTKPQPFVQSTVQPPRQTFT